jgi:hypothetical protein
MPKEAIAVAARPTPQAPVAAQEAPKVPVNAIRDLVEWAIDIYGIEVTKFAFVKKTVAWLEAAEREGKGK